MPDFTKDIKDYYAREIKVIQDLDVSELNKAMNALLACYEREGTVYVFGNGGSSATASHMVCDFNKGTCANVEKRFRFVCLNDNVPTLMAVANDVGFDDVFFYQLENKLRKGDLVLAISGSGNSRNVVKAVEYAKKAGDRGHGHDRLRRGQARQDERLPPARAGGRHADRRGPPHGIRPHDDADLLALPRDQGGPHSGI
jgi:D-sedoheptulose 7-phosphate isomerase